MTTTDNLPEGYGWVLFTAGAIGFVQLGLGMNVMKYRKVFHSTSFMNQPGVLKLQKEHKEHFDSDINEDGYPDMGSGKYSQLLDYSDWVEFNNAQRGHQNMIENSAPALTAMVLSGLFQPKAAACLGATYAVSRILYAMGYQSKDGPKGCIPFALTSNATLVGLFGLLLFNGSEVLKQNGGLKIEFA